MITREITLCGKQVTLGYCYATEIAYKLYSDEDIEVIIKDIVAAIQEKQMTDVMRSIYLILSAVQAYYDSVGQEMPVVDKDIMYASTPLEFSTAIGTIIAMRGEFYHIPSDEPQDKPKKGKAKKTKNA